MNKHTVSMLLLSLTVAVSACSKTDLQQEHAAAATTTTTAARQWQPVGSWQQQSQDSTTLYSYSVADSAITDAVVTDGLVLVYARKGAEVSALPLRQQVGSTWVSWNYGVSAGRVELSAETRSGAAAVEGYSLQYFVVPAQQLHDLEGQGLTKADLMGLSFDKAKHLLN